MSTRSHFIYEEHVEAYEETAAPRSIFGKHVGWDVYLFIQPDLIKSVKMEGDYLFIETKLPSALPSKFKIWGDAIVLFEIDFNDGLMVILEGGHHITKQIIALNFNTKTT